MPKDFRRDRNFPALREYKARANVRELLRKHGAHSVGIGVKQTNGEETGKLALVFYVAAKRPDDVVSEAEMIPPTIEFTSQKDRRRRRITTDVVDTPPARFEVDPETRIRPVPGGVSGGINGSTGTIGGWVWDETDDSIVMLSNHHVFGHTAGTDILQQGTADGGSLPADKIGDVKRGIVRTTTGTNTVDAAIGDPDDSGVYDLSVLEIGPAVYATDTATLNMEVEKFGQTTEHTFGKIISVDYTTLVDGTFLFEDCLRIEPISPSSDWSAGGDSGSLVFRQEPTTEGGEIKPVVGLHFAGGGIYGVACKIGNVFDDLDLTTLCSGAFASFLDNLSIGSSSEAEDEDTAAAEIDLGGIAFDRDRMVLRPGLRVGGLRPVAPAPGLSFSRKARRHLSSRNPNRGLARDVQLRLQGTRKGRQLTNTIDDHRGELLTLLAKDGDVRRVAMAALQPTLRNVVTTDEVLNRRLSAGDVARYERLADTVAAKGSDDLANAVAGLRRIVARGEGSSLGALFGLTN